MNKLLEVQQLSKIFSDHKGQNVRLWEKICFSLDTGSNMAICGESGSGKSTLLLTLGGLETPTSGRVLFLNNLITTKAHTPGIAYIFQHYRLVEEINVWDNILLPAKIQGQFNVQTTTKYAEEITEKLELTTLRNRLPNTLSGGEQQRVAIARALITKPKLLLADEPTGSLDESTGQKVMDLFFSICQELQTSFILVTHNRSFAKRTKRVFSLKEGTLIDETC